jgi:hypothetical protein
MKDLNCWNCKHIYMQPAEPGYSEYTPGSDVSISCRKGHWDFDACETSEEKARELFRTANNCKDFEDIRDK